MMKKESFFLLTVLIAISTTSTFPMDDLTDSIRNSLLEQQVLALLETFRATMLTGSEDIPILDPLQVEHLHIDDDVIELPGSHVTIKNLVLYYLSTFIVDDLRISISSILPLQYSVQFEAHIPTIILETGEYDLNISAMSYQIFGKGDGKVQVIQPKVTGSLTFGVWSMSITNVIVEFGLKKFEPHLTGLFHHDGANDFANAFLANLVPEIVTLYKDEIREFMSPLIQDLGNKLLENVSIGDLFPQFVGIQHNAENVTPNRKM